MEPELFIAITIALCDLILLLDLSNTYSEVRPVQVPANVTVRPASTSPHPRGFRLPCLRCGEQSSITLNLAYVDDDEALHCPECEAGYSLSEVRDVIDAWQRLLAWADLCPAREE